MPRAQTGSEGATRRRTRAAMLRAGRLPKRQRHILIDTCESADKPFEDDDGQKPIND